MKRILTIMTLALALVVPFGATALATDPFKQVCDAPTISKERPRGSEVCANDSRKDGTNPIAGDHGVLTRVVNTIALIAGAIAVVFIIIAGFQYVMAGGDSNSINGAKNTIIYALAGVVLIVIARSIIVFVINRL